MDDVRRAWTSRQERIRSARVAWVEDWFIAAHARPRLDTSAKPGKKPELLPDRDLTFRSSGAMSLSGKMLRYVYEGEYWHDSLGELLQRTYVTTFDGETSQSSSVHTPPRPNDLPPYGTIGAEARHRERGTHHLMPTLMAFRPCDPDTGGVNITQWVLSERTGVIGDTACVIMVPSVVRGDHKNYWLDPQREFLVLRIVRRDVGGATISTHDISYLRDRAHGWLPSGWKWVYEGGYKRVREQIIAKVTKCEINIDIPRSEFQIEFPPGMLVRDLKTKHDYIQKEDLGKRTITKDEIQRGARYDEYLATESGTAGLKRRSWMPWVVAAATVGLLTAVVIVWRLRARRASQKGANP
jgi:hypothetical protein